MKQIHGLTARPFDLPYLLIYDGVTFGEITVCETLKLLPAPTSLGLVFFLSYTVALKSSRMSRYKTTHSHLWWFNLKNLSFFFPTVH